MNKIQKTLVAAIGLFLVGLFGCSAFQDAITPCHIDPDCAAYADANVPMLLPWTTVTDAKYVNKKMEYVHSIGQLEYNYLKENMTSYLADAAQFQAAVFSPSGPVGLLLPALGGLGIGAIAIPRRQERELKKKVNGNQG